MNIYKPKQFAKMLGITVRTLQRWDSLGKIKSFRSPTNRRYYTQEQYDAYMGNPHKEENRGKVLIYARVSSKNQQDDLKNQIQFLREFANARGMIVDEVLSDIGSGLNYNRKKWNQLISESLKGNIQTIIIAHKDRFVRFGFDWFYDLLKKNGTDIIVVNNESLSPKAELVQDLISIIHIFSCRIYGLRKYKKTLKEDDSLC